MKQIRDMIFFFRNTSNFHLLEVVDCGSDPQLQVTENKNRTPHLRVDSINSTSSLRSPPPPPLSSPAV